MKRHLLILLVAAAGVSPAGLSAAGPPHLSTGPGHFAAPPNGHSAFVLPQPAAPSWVFRRSYYSHDPVTLVRIGTAYHPGGPVYTRPQGEFVKNGYRNLRSTIAVGGYVFEQANIWESWVQTGSQY